MQTTSTGTETTSGARTFTILSFVFAALALFLFPPILGSVALVLGIIGRAKGDSLATWAIVASIPAMILGMLIGAALFAAD